MTISKTFMTVGMALCLSISTQALADSITGELVFVKRASFAGVVFVEEKQHSTVNATLDQKDKEFTHKMIVASPGGKIVFNNSDSFEHNIYSSGSKSAKFDVGLMPTGSKNTITANWGSDSVVRIGCKIHPKMKAYIANIDSSIYQVLPFKKKTKNYTIKLAGVSGDTVVVKLKIPKYPDTVVSLKAGESKTVDVIKKGKKKATLTLKRQ